MAKIFQFPLGYHENRERLQAPQASHENDEGAVPPGKLELSRNQEARTAMIEFNPDERPPSEVRKTIAFDYCYGKYHGQRGYDKASVDPEGAAHIKGVADGEPGDQALDRLMRMLGQIWKNER